MKTLHVGDVFMVIGALGISACSGESSSASTGSGNGATAEFTFVVQGGQSAIATTQAQATGNDKRVVVFTPFLEKTDGNLYQAALQSLYNLYGKERGLFLLQDAQTKAEPSLGGNAICWKISNPTADYCVFPTKDDATGRIGALTVWVR